MILVDTREQGNKKILNYFDKQGIEWTYEALEFGDYIAPLSDKKVVVERKKDLVEFAGNCGKNHARFKRELEKCDEAGYTMIVLIGEDMTFPELENWVNPKAKYKTRKLKDGTIKKAPSMTGSMILKIVRSWQQKHNLQIEFVEKSKMPQKIVELLF